MVEHGEVVDAAAEVEKKPGYDDRREGAGDFGRSEGLGEEEEDKNRAAYSDDGGFFVSWYFNAGSFSSGAYMLRCRDLLP